MRLIKKIKQLKETIKERRAGSIGFLPFDEWYIDDPKLRRQHMESRQPKDQVTPEKPHNRVENV